MKNDLIQIASTFKTPAGWLSVLHDECHVHRAVFSDSPGKTHSNSPLALLISSQIDAWFDNSLNQFELPLKPQGTAFQLRVWNSLLNIPVGHTVTYGELASTLQSGPRAIGQACKKNPIVLFIPCHRVVGKNNHGGYMGQADALRYKIALLGHEKLT